MSLFKPKQNKQKQDEQLSMPIKKQNSEVVFGIKRSVDKSITYAGVIPYWRSFFFVAAFMSSLINIGLLGYVLYKNFSKLPAEVPLFYNQATASWTNYSRNTLFIIPIVILFFAIFVTILNAKIYRFDRRLVLMLNISIILANIFLVVGLGQILSLLLVY